MNPLVLEPGLSIRIGSETVLTVSFFDGRLQDGIQGGKCYINISTVSAFLGDAHLWCCYSFASC